MSVVDTFEDVRRVANGTVSLVPTMGYLHEGHLSLINEANRTSDFVVVSVFVNPLQFGQPEDLETYPRDLARDVALAVGAGADVIFSPDDSYMYPNRPETTITVGSVAEGMEGSARPGHFEGVATVVAKLLAGVQPDVAFFGKKDAQQLAVISTMANDLSFPVTIEGSSTVREADGLALSSRNVRLGSAARSTARSLSRGLMEAADAFEEGVATVERLKALVVEQLAHGGGDIDVEYVELADTQTAGPSDSLSGTQFLALAARVGGVRLIDNVALDSTTMTTDRGVRLTHPSILYGGG